MTSQENAWKTHPFLCKVCEDYKGLFNASKNFRFHICWHWWSHMINEPVLWQLLIQDPQNGISFFSFKVVKCVFLTQTCHSFKLLMILTQWLTIFETPWFLSICALLRIKDRVVFFNNQNYYQYNYNIKTYFPRRWELWFFKEKKKLF